LTLFKHKLSVSEKKQTVAETSSIGGCGELASLFCEKFMEGGLHVRGSIVVVQTTGCMPANANVAILISLFLVDTVK
jgi:hypothetical protein